MPGIPMPSLQFCTGNQLAAFGLLLRATLLAVANPLESELQHIQQGSDGHHLPAIRLIQYISALNQLHQTLGEAGCRSPVDDVMIKDHRQVEDLAWLNPPLDDGGLPGEASSDQVERVPGYLKPPAAVAFAKHTHGGDPDSARHGHRNAWIAAS